MSTPRTLLQLLLASSLLAAGAASATEPASAGEKDALRATLLESKEKNRGVTLHAGGASIAMVVTAVEPSYVVGRSQQASRIVVRMERIDAVSAAF